MPEGGGQVHERKVENGKEVAGRCGEGGQVEEGEEEGKEKDGRCGKGGQMEERKDEDIRYGKRGQVQERGEERVEKDDRCVKGGQVIEGVKNKTGMTEGRREVLVWKEDEKEDRCGKTRTGMVGNESRGCEKGKKRRVLQRMEGGGEGQMYEMEEDRRGRRKKNRCGE